MKQITITDDDWEKFLDEIDDEFGHRIPQEIWTRFDQWFDRKVLEQSES